MTRARLATFVALAVGAAFIAMVMVGSSGAAVTKLKAPLRGSDTTDADGRGRAVVKINPRARTACFNLRWRNLDDQPFAAHIHAGARGEDGPIVIPFFDAASPTAAIPDQITAVRGCARDQSRADLRQIRDTPRQYYVNVHTESFPGGAIRGQLRKF